MERLQDKLRQERTNDQPILNRCDFDIVERYVDSSSEEEDHLPEEQHGAEQQQLHEEQPNGRASQTGDPPRLSFPPALHRSVLNLQKDDLEERLNLGEIYGALDAASPANTNNPASAAHLTGGGSYQHRKSEPVRREKVNNGDVHRNGGTNELKEKHQLTFQLNQNELAKLQWTNPVSDEEVREIKSFSEVKLHEVRFDFEGKLRIQINETEMNKKKKKKIFNHFDGLYHHNDEPLNSGYTFPEMIFLCQSSNSSQVCIALKIMTNVFVNSHLRVFPFHDDLKSDLYRDESALPTKDKYSFGFTYRRFSTYLNSDLNLFDKLLFLLRHCRNRNIEMSSVHCLASYTFPNNVCALREDVVFDYWGERDSPVLKFFHDYEAFSYLDFFSDAAFLFEGCNVYFYDTRKGGSAKVPTDECEDKSAKEYEEEGTSPGEVKLGGEETGHSPNESAQWGGSDWSDVAKKLEKGNIAKREKGANGGEHPNLMITEVPIEEELIAHLEPLSSITDDLQEMQKINVKMVHLGGFHAYSHEDILTNISTILQNNFGVVQVENSCVCLLIGLLCRRRQQVNLLTCTDLIANLERIYESKIIGSELNKQREDGKINQPDYVETNFTYNLITLIKYVIIYNYDKDLLQKFKVLSFLLFYRSLPFIQNGEDKREVFFLGSEVLKVCRLLLFCNLYVEPVDYFHDLINHLHKKGIHDDHDDRGVYKKFLSQVYLYLATYNIVGRSVDLSGFLYTNKIINTLQMQVKTLFRQEGMNGDPDVPTDDTPVICVDRQKNKWDFAHLCNLQLIHQCGVYLFSVFWSMRRKHLIGEKYVGKENVEAVLETLQVLLRAVIDQFHDLLEVYTWEQQQKEPSTHPRKDASYQNIIQTIIRRMKEGPLPFNYVIYKNEIDLHFFFVILLQILNIILLIVLELPFFSPDKRDHTTLKFLKRIAQDVAKFEEDTLVHFKKDIFHMEHVQDSYSLLLPMSYLFYNIHGFTGGTHLMCSHTDQPDGDAVERLLYSLSFCSSVPLSYFSLRAIFTTPSPGIISPGRETNGGISSSQNCDHFGHASSEEMGTFPERSNERNKRMIEETPPTGGDHVDIPKNIILFLRKYIQGKFLLYHSKKNIFLLLLKNIFRECNRKCGEQERVEFPHEGGGTERKDALVHSVFKFLLNRHIIHFIGKHMDVSIFFKYFIQIFIVNEGKCIGDSLGEKMEVYSHLVRIAEEYIFKRVACSDSEGEHPLLVHDIHRVVSDFVRDNPPNDGNCESANTEDGPGAHSLDIHVKRLLQTNRRSIKGCIWQKKIQISTQLSVAIFEKIIESFKMAYFFSPLMFAILFFLSSTSFPEECRNVFYRDTDLLKILSKNVFIRFSDDGKDYIVFTTSTCYGREETNFLIDLTPLFPSIFSLMLDDSKADWFAPSMHNYFTALRSQYPYPSLLHFLFYVSTNGM
ncbi:Uncharacterized protein PCOAH_00013750 [Plasmodium coatneyi]|uniref:RPAP1 C-terminal domain-containing protein n=1 Tax=Plasmodium coatneyi TaxID=208452 RepID=A0A1B1DW63_9APIC|nr:Uncharacterized protein PCOAH_00013750 [Plasmodium coatneyi]ANQ07023.1 Uncharacterized protein PCOAH_00013750 [Plasmodium coatneyi]